MKVESERVAPVSNRYESVEKPGVVCGFVR